MRGLIFPAVTALQLMVCPIGHAYEKVPTTANQNLPYPSTVALVSEPPAGWTFQEDLASLPLYFSDADSAGRSNCYDPCAKQWIPLPAPATAKALGDWTVVKRKDGRLQWAFQQHPIYTRLHDSARMPTGDGVDGIWHLMPHFQ